VDAVRATGPGSIGLTALGKRADAAAAEKALRELTSAMGEVEYGTALLTAAKAEPLVRRAQLLVELAARIAARAPDERVEPYRLRIHETQGLAIGERLAEALDLINPIDETLLPDGVVDRPADVWDPLLGIAESLSPPWAIRAARPAPISWARARPSPRWDMSALTPAPANWPW
jgi:hypothetical protein